MRIRQLEDVGSIVRTRRRQLGWSQLILASRVGVGRQWITELELGKKSASLHLVIKTLDTLQLVIDISDDTAARLLPGSLVGSVPALEVRARKAGGHAGRFGAPTSPGALASARNESQAPGKNSSDHPVGYTYQVTNFEAMPLNRDQLYAPEYRPVLERMVGHVILSEGPIFADVLARRIARVHGLSRATAKLLEITREVTDRRFARLAEDGRDVIWPDADVLKIVPFRHATLRIREHQDIPTAELTSLALSLWSAGQTTDKTAILMGKQLGLVRISGNTRLRFKAAAELARNLRSDQ